MMPVPDPSRPGGTKLVPDYGALRDTNRDLIDKLLRHPLSETQVNLVMNVQRRAFFVDKNFGRLTSNVQGAWQSLEIVDDASLPSRQDIDSLQCGAPLSLPAILKLHFAFDVAIRTSHLAAIRYFNLEAGNPLDAASPPIVVPALLGVDPEKFSGYIREVGAADKGLLDYVRSRGRTQFGQGKTLRYPETFRPLNLLARPHDRFPKNGCGNYLLTVPAAKLIHGYFSDCYEKASGDKWTVKFAELFVGDPDKLNGVGINVKPLDVQDGNYLSDV
jgi:hypothetical protein